MSENLFVNNSKKQSGVSFWLLLFVFAVFFAAVFFAYQLNFNSKSFSVQKDSSKFFDYNKYGQYDGKLYKKNNIQNEVIRGAKLILKADHSDFPYAPRIGILDLDSGEINTLEAPEGYEIIDYSRKGTVSVALAVDKNHFANTGSIHKSLTLLIDENFTQDYSFKDASRTEFDVDLYNVGNISFNGKSLLFSATNSEAVPNISKWKIYKYDIKSSALQYLTNGLYPKWLNERKFLYLAEDGLRVYNIQDGRSELIRSLKGASGKNTLALSGNGQIIIWNLNENDTLVAQFLSYNPVILRDIKVINLPFAQFALSYRGTKLVQAIFEMSGGSFVANTVLFATSDTLVPLKKEKVAELNNININYFALLDLIN